MVSPSTQRVLVTGAGGFIASAVIPQLIASGRSVIALDHAWAAGRQAANRRLLDGDVVRVVDMDMTCGDLRPLLRSSDAVIHLAGVPGVQSSWSDGFEHHMGSNVVATQRLLEAALDAPVQRIVVASSSSVYGSIDRGRASERSLIRPISPYGASKAAMELVLTGYAERGVSAVPLRYFTVYGPRQRPDMAIHRIINAAQGGPPFPVRGDGTQARSFTFVDDVARATIAALADDGTEPINISGPDTVALNDVIDCVADVMGSPVRRATVAAAPGDPQRTSANVDRAARRLDWRPLVDLDAGLRRQIEWQRALIRA